MEENGNKTLEDDYTIHEDEGVITKDIEPLDMNVL